jgi:hypothetical protein
MTLCSEFRSQGGGDVAGANYGNGVRKNWHWCQ